MTLSVSPVNGLMFHSAYIVEQAISSLKTTIKGDVSRPEIQARIDDRAEVRRLGIPLEEM